jgi:hypothetical protein
MKKSELIQLTQVIEHLVAREVRKQLPQLIGEAFQNMMGKSVVSERQKHVQQSISEVVEQIEPAMVADPDDFKMSMRDLFAGAIPTGVRMPIHEEGSIAPQQPKHYTKDPKINAILNETVSDLRQRERMVGGAAFMGGYSPSIEMASAAMPGTVGAGEMMNEGEVPASPGVPLSRPPQAMSESHIPGEMIPEGISALDVARQVPLSQPVAKALTKNYSAMMKLIDNKRKKI